MSLKEGFDCSIKVEGRIVTNFRYADDVALLAGSANELQELLKKAGGKQKMGIKIECGKDKGNFNIQKQQPGRFSNKIRRGDD